MIWVGWRTDDGRGHVRFVVRDEPGVGLVVDDVVVTGLVPLAWLSALDVAGEVAAIGRGDEGAAA